MPFADTHATYVLSGRPAAVAASSQNASAFARDSKLPGTTVPDVTNATFASITGGASPSLPSPPPSLPLPLPPPPQIIVAMSHDCGGGHHPLGLHGWPCCSRGSKQP